MSGRSDRRAPEVYRASYTSCPPVLHRLHQLISTVVLYLVGRGILLTCLLDSPVSVETLLCWRQTPDGLSVSSLLQLTRPVNRSQEAKVEVHVTVSSAAFSLRSAVAPERTTARDSGKEKMAGLSKAPLTERRND
ncbi:hypothetical protein INR49_023240 [Caranx melampygus]|nr:hypothetical protein INR49_023240 [Caranx melampygus]